ncbi:GNAT family N-acetyltransferase [Paenibacillus amylolyticus]|nr:GNAT family N-acetyltransferase [Paenibacillus amylolyticus]WFR65210.1 GNAT family N-acetyltransferase [Paenibacillus amylolyticus]
MSVICRKAVPEDVEPLYEMIKGYAERGIMLPRSREILHRQLEHFIVAEVDGEVVGCGSLCRLGNDLVEVRSLGISEGHKGLGIGSRLLDRLVEEAERQQIPKVMALTYEVSFFSKTALLLWKGDFPEKVWTDCVHCSKQDCCDEIAVLKELNVPA